MFLKYSTSNIILRIEMLTMKKEIKLFVVFCILAWFPYSFFASLCFCYPLLFLLPRYGLNPNEEQIVQHELKREKQLEWELEHFCDSRIYKCRSQAEKYGFEDLCRMRVFSFS